MFFDVFSFLILPSAGFPWDFGEGDISVLHIMQGQQGADVFNYFFTIILFFGLIAFSIGLLIKLISRS